MGTSSLLLIQDTKALAKLALLKPGILGKLAEGLAGQGIDISSVVSLAEYLYDVTTIKLFENATFDTISDELLERLIPFLDDKSKLTIFQKILNGEMDWHLIKILLPYVEYMTSHIEAAVIEGALPKETLKILNDYIFRNEVKS